MSEANHESWMDYYCCPYCGEYLKPEDILFIDDGMGLAMDQTREEFMRRSASIWNYETDNQNNKVFRGRYFKAGANCVCQQSDDHGYPLMLRVAKGTKGLTDADLRAGLTNDDNDTAADDHEKSVEAVRQQDSLEDLEEDDVNLDDYDGSESFASNVTDYANRADQEKFLTDRVCRNCHFRLDEEFGIVPVINVTMMGGRAAGKTAYLISLIHQLNKQLSERHLGSATLLQESKAYYDIQNRHFINDNGNPMPTPVDENLFPFVFKYVNISRETRKKCFVAIYDVAGEGTQNAKYLVNRESIKRADTMLLILDPNQLNRGVYYKNQSNGIGESNTGSHDYCEDPLEQFFGVSMSNGSRFGIFEGLKHIVAVTTKIDFPMQQNPGSFAGQNELKRNLIYTDPRTGKETPEHDGVLDMNVIDDLERAVNGFYNSTGIKDIKTMIQGAFVKDKNTDKLPTVHLAAVSIYTMRPLEDIKSSKIVFERRVDENAPKHRIIEPFLMILACRNVISAVRPQAQGTQTASSAAGNKETKKSRWLFGRRK